MAQAAAIATKKGKVAFMYPTEIILGGAAVYLCNDDRAKYDMPDMFRPCQGFSCQYQLMEPADFVVKAAVKPAETKAEAPAEADAAAAKKLEDEAAAAKKLEDEAAAAKKLEEEAAAKRLADEAAAAKKLEDEAAAAKKLEEEAAAKRLADEAAAATDGSTDAKKEAKKAIVNSRSMPVPASEKAVDIAEF